MLLWPSYQAEVIFATPPKRGAASPRRLKGPLSPRPKWQTWFLSLHLDQGLWRRVLRILSEPLQGSRRYLLISGILSASSTPGEASASFCSQWVDLKPARWHRAPHISEYEERIGHRGVYPPHSCLQPIPLCVNRLSKPFKCIYFYKPHFTPRLFSCCEWPRASVMQFYGTAHKTLSITNNNSQSDILNGVYSNIKNGQVVRTAAHILSYTVWDISKEQADEPSIQTMQCFVIYQKVFQMVLLLMSRFEFKWLSQGVCTSWLDFSKAQVEWWREKKKSSY